MEAITAGTNIVEAVPDISETTFLCSKISQGLSAFGTPLLRLHD